MDKGVGVKGKTDMREIRIAVCLFGQIRTGQYCAPAIKAGYDLIDGIEMDIRINRERYERCVIRIDYFCWTKDFDTGGQQTGISYDNYLKIDHTVIENLFNVYKPLKTWISTVDDEPKNSTTISSNLSWDNPKPLFLGMLSAVNLKKEYEIGCGWRYDFCIVQRFDILTAPFNPAEIMLRQHGIRDNLLYVDWVAPFNNEDGNWGMGDFWIGGDSFSIDMMTASLGQSLIDMHRSNSEINESQLGLGPNIQMYNACKKNNIFVMEFPNCLIATPVRPAADLTLDPMDHNTAKIHYEFFKSNHPGIK